MVSEVWDVAAVVVVGSMMGCLWVAEVELSG